jgi:hypothetical protein
MPDMRAAGAALALALCAAPALAQTEVAPARASANAARTAAANTPAADAREAVIGVLDKRLGRTEFFTLKPGERFRFGDLSGVLRTCERTAPWERPTQSGAFVQVAETPRQIRRGDRAAQPRMIFSGWLFAESPSLNPMRHPVYDVWLKSCAMRFPDTPPPATAAAGQPAPARPARRAPAAAPDTPAPAAETPAPASPPPDPRE